MLIEQSHSSIYILFYFLTKINKNKKKLTKIGYLYKDLVKIKIYHIIIGGIYIKIFFLTNLTIFPIWLKLSKKKLTKFEKLHRNLSKNNNLP